MKRVASILREKKVVEHTCKDFAGHSRILGHLQKGSEKQDTDLILAG
jgi:hypothetical protein